MPYVVPDAVREPLYAIVPYFNPWRWKSREKHTIRAIKHFQDSGAVVVLIEAAFNRREFAFANSGLDGTPANCGVLASDHRFQHRYIGLRTRDELWLKENLINVAISQLPYDWQQVCWLDSDVHFLRPNWAGECIHKLQHYAFLQMFSEARDLTPSYELMPEEYVHAAGKSFMRDHIETFQTKVAGTLSQSVQGSNIRLQLDLTSVAPPPYPPLVWPGLAWAARRQEFDAVGGLFDIGVWGGGDYDMAHALVELATPRMDRALHQNYQTMLKEWEARCIKHVRRNVGVMTGTIVHHFHGRKTDRKYVEKRRLMRRTLFDPLRHLKRDYQGLWQLHDDGSEQFVHFRDMMRAIAESRNEDTNDTRLDLWDQDR